jgi:hypothetical protein
MHFMPRTHIILQHEPRTPCLHSVCVYCYCILFLQHIRTQLAPGVAFNLLEYSFGGILALEEGHIYLVYSSPDFLQTIQECPIGHNEDQFEIKLICIMFNLVASHKATPTAVNQVPDSLNYCFLLNFEVQVVRNTHMFRL